eukprot:2458586-Lingulodinium_polyedra.AAC.1
MAHRSYAARTHAEGQMPRLCCYACTPQLNLHSSCVAASRGLEPLASEASPTVDGQVRQEGRCGKGREEGPRQDVCEINACCWRWDNT